MILRPTIVSKLLLGVLVAACLPRFPEGERGVQCWTDRAVDRAACVRTALWCLEDSEDGTEAERCISALERCEAAGDELAGQCDRRTGCIAAHAACEDACIGGFDVSPACLDGCRIDLELCAPWIDLDCERECEEPLGECLVTATHTFHEAACDREHLDCLLECYDRSPDEGAEQGTCDPGRYTCDDDRITACVDGNAVRDYSCSEVCQALGSQSTGCSGDDCECLGQPIGGTLCEQATGVLCACSVELDGVACSPEDTTQLLQQCAADPDSLPFECYADFAGDVPEACELLFFDGACSCPFTDDGECDEPEGTGICPEGSDPGDC